ncbi:MAG: bifunctional [glutamate--ammonia ligase]-adenylyl-L-tyrosine phosphorylase/[glutamate--ammonia-ligase] adenylyltransferase [Nitrospirae bacterium]|nr:bifunctional [glutamate--ammonia ligase]-adenylyl-L-tyrosine phosphorylase/[glutamate--ammonia-ligase] adenylyltransferase [Nitrospirota bacterium]
MSSVLAGIGFTDSRRAAVNLQLLRRDTSIQNKFDRLLPVILQSAIDSPDPDMSLNNLERFASSYEEKDKLYLFLSSHKEIIGPFLLLLGSSQYLCNFLFSAPRECIEWLAVPNFLKRIIAKDPALKDLRKQVTPETTLEDVKTVLRRFRKMEYLRISIRDLLGYGTLTEITQEISVVADVALQIAYEVCSRDLEKRYGIPQYYDINGNPWRCTFTVLGMGKLGGEELNYSSDIDIMYLYHTEKGETSNGLLTNHQYFVKLSEMISQVIGQTTDEGFVFRVDTRLRPEGERGDLASPLRSFEVYYESWGQTWERAALLKVRPVAGDEELGRAFLKMIQPFVYRKYLDFTAIDEISGMKVKIDKSIAAKGKDIRNVKLGYGGIREIEFFVQALQLLYGGKEPWIRERNTMRALHKLAQKGFISYDEEEALSAAYQFMRRVEHMIQIVSERQTYVMPDGPDDLNTLAKRIGYEDKSKHKAYEQLLKDYNTYTKSVRKIYDDLFLKKGIQGEEGSEEGGIDTIIGGVVSEDEAINILSESNFRDPGKAYRNIMLLRDGAAFSHQTPRSRQIFLRIFPSFFSHITSSSDPDLALNNLESLISSVGARETIYSFFEENPQAVESVIKIFSTSEYLSKLVIRHPEIVDMFLDPEEMLKKHAKVDMQAELSSLIEQCNTYAEKLDMLRKFKYIEEVRIGYVDILNYVSPGDASRYLSNLADVSLVCAYKIASDEVRRVYGRPLCRTTDGGVSEAGFCIVSMGKLGGEEISYGSDLDLVFLYSGDGETDGKQSISNHEFFTHLSSKTMSVLTSMTREGSVFKIDVRLRPSGSKGPLSQSITAFRTYVEQHADIWELQSLTRARIIAGDESLGREVLDCIYSVLYGVNRSPEDLLPAIRNMRKRMEAEVSRENNEYYDIKAGEGGIVDIEFIVQYLQLLHGLKYPSIRVTNTLSALESLYKERLLSKDQYTILKKSYVYLRTLENRLRIVQNVSAHLLSKSHDKITSLAMRMGYKDSKRVSGSTRLIKEYESLRKNVRGVFEQILD